MAPLSMETEVRAADEADIVQTLPPSVATEVILRTEENWLSPRNGLSFIAILLSVSSLVYTAKTQARSRKQSVNDEFWFRKVAYPLILEPITATYTDTASKLPMDHLPLSDIDAEMVASVSAFCSEFQEILEQQRGRLMMLSATFDQKRAQATYQKMSEALEAFEDAVVTYCHDVETASAAARRPRFSRVATIQKIQASLAAFISPLREWQHSE